MNTQIFKYNENPITFMTGAATMVSATQMARPFKKRPVDWLRFQQSQSFIKELSKVRNHTLADLVQVKKGGSTPGTWMHEDVALEFARWLSPQFAIWCNDRIKELMKYGMTATTQTIDNILADPDNAIKVLKALKDERKKVKCLEDANKCYHSENRRLIKLNDKNRKQLEIQAPKVEYADNVLSSDSTYSSTQIAKELGMTSQRLNRELHAWGVQYKQGSQWFLYKQYQDKGYTKTRTYTCTKKDGRIATMLSTAWTEAGRKFIHETLKKSIFDPKSK